MGTAPSHKKGASLNGSTAVFGIFGILFMVQMRGIYVGGLKRAVGDINFRNIWRSILWGK